MVQAHIAAGRPGGDLVEEGQGSAVKTRGVGGQQAGWQKNSVLKGRCGLAEQGSSCAAAQRLMLCDCWCSMPAIVPLLLLSRA